MVNIVLARIWKDGVQICYSLKTGCSNCSTYYTSSCVLQIKQGVHLANRASKRHPKVLLAVVIRTTSNTMDYGGEICN